MPVDIVALARALVLALFPSISLAIQSGTTPREAFDAVWEEHGAGWRETYGPDVAREAAATLDALTAWHVLSPVGRAVWYTDAPVADLTPAPAEVIVSPAEAISPLQRAWRRLWGGPG